MKGVFDWDILSKIKLMVMSIAVLKFLFYCEWCKNDIFCLDDCIDVVRRFSEEIEYSEENLKVLEDWFYGVDVFSVENLLGLF